MRKIGSFLLFLTISTANSFTAIPCKAENFSQRYNNIYYAPANQPSEVIRTNKPTGPEFNQLENGNLEITAEAARPATSKKPNKLEYQEPSDYPEASKNYQGVWY